MGRGPGDPESTWPGLVQDDSGDVLELPPDLVDESLTGGGIGLAAFMPLTE